MALGHPVLVRRSSNALPAGNSHALFGMMPSRPVIARSVLCDEAILLFRGLKNRDCFVASLLAMTGRNARIRACRSAKRSAPGGLRGGLGPGPFRRMTVARLRWHLRANRGCCLAGFTRPTFLFLAKPQAAPRLPRGCAWPRSEHSRGGLRPCGSQGDCFLICHCEERFCDEAISVP